MTEVAPECCATWPRASLAISGLGTIWAGELIFKVFIMVSNITGAAVPSDEAHLNRFPKAGALVLNLRLAARKCYAS